MKNQINENKRMVTLTHQIIVNLININFIFGGESYCIKIKDIQSTDIYEIIVEIQKQDNYKIFAKT